MVGKYAGKSVVFIGDSITDTGRTYPVTSEYGVGYAALCIAALKRRFPFLSYYNRGVAGECVGQIGARWQTDCLGLAPCLVTFLAGVNDVDYSYRHADHVFDETALLTQLTEMFSSVARSGAKLMVIEPYAFDGALYHDDYLPRMLWMKENMARAAQRYAFVYVRAPMTPGLTLDGIHPTEEGHRLLYRTWMAQAEKSGIIDRLAREDAAARRIGSGGI